MGFFRKSSKTRDRHEPISAPPERPGAGRQATGRDMHTAPHHPQSAPYSSSSSTFAASTGTGYGQAHHSFSLQQGTLARPPGGMSAAIHSAFSPHRHDDDFDDAASYHSISSNPGMSQSAGARPSGGPYTPMMTTRYANTSNEGHNTAQIAQPDIDSYYSAPRDENYFRSPDAIPDSRH
ncbi:hypothetical protein IWW54_002211, partial [Coemansia sp. RSA 2705]